MRSCLLIDSQQSIVQKKGQAFRENEDCTCESKRTKDTRDDIPTNCHLDFIAVGDGDIDYDSFDCQSQLNQGTTLRLTERILTSNGL